MTCWYVIQTLPHQEIRAELNLLRQGYNVWLPRIKKTRRHARRVDYILSPLFPGYLFLNLDISKQSWRSINGTFGVKGLLCQNSKPSRLPDRFIEELQHKAREGGGIIELDEIHVGKNVKIEYGAFKECIGTILKIADKDRILMMLRLLGREVQTMVSRHNVVPVRD